MRRVAGIVVLAAALAGCSVANNPGSSATSASGAPGSATAAGSSAHASATAKPDRSATVVMSGDMLWHDTVWMSAQQDAKRTGAGDFDFAPMFAGVKPIISGADAAICHEEVPIAPPGQAPTNYPVFGAPPAVAQGIKDVGYDACTTASNHSWDKGFAGVKATLDEFDKVGLGHVGTARDQAESDKPYIFTLANGLKLGIVEGAYSLNGFELPDDEKFAWTPWDADTLLKKAKATRAAGADIVMVAMHGGDEYGHQPSQEQVDLATKLTASPDVDLVYGHHVHVVQPWTKINGKWVIYGLGNMVAQHLPSQVDGYEGVIARIGFKVGGDGKVSVEKAEYIPTYWNFWGMGADPIRVVSVNQALADPARTDKARLQQAKARTEEVVTSMDVQGLAEA